MTIHDSQVIHSYSSQLIPSPPHAYLYFEYILYSKLANIAYCTSVKGPLESLQVLGKVVEHFDSLFNTNLILMSELAIVSSNAESMASSELGNRHPRQKVVIYILVMSASVTVRKLAMPIILC